MTAALSAPAGLREARLEDASACGRVFYDAFASLAGRHGFPVEPGSPQFTEARCRQMLAHPGFHALAAERDGELVGCLFLDERAPVVGVGPVAVDPVGQDAGVGRALMEAALARGEQRGAQRHRLVQTAYHYRSLALYAKLGFTVREPLSVVQGRSPAVEVADRRVRPAVADDVAEAEALCVRVHGFARGGELSDAIADGTALVVERSDSVVGYATGLGYGWHAVGEDDEAIEALLAAVPEYRGLGVLVPSRRAGLLSWCLARGLRIVQQSHLMTTGEYAEPRGAWLPSILY